MAGLPVGEESTVLHSSGTAAPHRLSESRAPSAVFKTVLRFRTEKWSGWPSAPMAGSEHVKAGEEAIDQPLVMVASPGVRGASSAIDSGFFIEGFFIEVFIVRRFSREDAVNFRAVTPALKILWAYLLTVKRDTEKNCNQISWNLRS
jgi:hypothetical protein